MLPSTSLCYKCQVDLSKLLSSMYTSSEWVDVREGIWSVVLSKSWLSGKNHTVSRLSKPHPYWHNPLLMLSAHHCGRLNDNFDEPILPRHVVETGVGKPCATASITYKVQSFQGVRRRLGKAPPAIKLMRMRMPRKPRFGTDWPALPKWTTSQKQFPPPLPQSKPNIEQCLNALAITCNQQKCTTECQRK